MGLNVSVCVQFTAPDPLPGNLLQRQIIKASPTEPLLANRSPAGICSFPLSTCELMLCAVVSGGWGHFLAVRGAGSSNPGFCDEKSRLIMNTGSSLNRGSCSEERMSY
jgi:hypothetical protein